MPRWEAIVLALSVAAMGGWWVGKHGSGPRTGLIVVTAVPPDATVLIDNVLVGDSAPVTVEERPGPVTVSVTRDGYVRNDQTVEVRPGHATAVNVTLEASPDTGFELVSDPPGELLWLDGLPMRGARGWQARTSMRATGISPGPHVLEIRGGRFKDWRLEFDVEPGLIRKIHATLLPRL